MRHVGGVVAVAAGVVLLAGCGVAPTTGAVSTSTSSTSTATLLEDAGTTCEVADDVIRDEGESMTLDTMGKDDEIGDSLEVVACVLNHLDAPEYFIQHIDSTRALDGQQTDEWGDVEARWTYHPDVGMKLTLIDRS